MALPHTDLTDLTGFSFVGGKSHGCSPLVCSKGSHSPCLTQISQISQGFPLWGGNLTDAHTDPTDLTDFFVGFVVWN